MLVKTEHVKYLYVLNETVSLYNFIANDLFSWTKRNRANRIEFYGLRYSVRLTRSGIIDIKTIAGTIVKIFQRHIERERHKL